MSFNRFSTVVALAFAIAVVSTAVSARAQVKPGDVITPDNASQVVGLVSPGNFILVKQGMEMKITPTTHMDWPPPYKDATERYSPQVSLSSDGELKGYVAGLPFPLVDANDPQAATKIMWNFTFRPLSTDDIDTHNIEAISHKAGSSNEIEHFTFGLFQPTTSIRTTSKRLVTRPAHPTRSSTSPSATLALTNMSAGPRSRRCRSIPMS